MNTIFKMYEKHIWMFPIIIVLLMLPQNALSCPHSCACYVNSEVHCTFRSLAAVPARMPKHVERINLGFNSIQSIAEESFAGLSKLEMLLIHSNDIHNIPNGAFQDLISLQVFKMSYNKLKVITSHTFHGLSGLTRLHVDHNRIEFIHPNAFHGLTSLRLLHLEGNLIQQLHANTFCTFHFLDYFRQSTLKHLYLSDNMIQTLPAGMIQSMPLLENLYLHGNPWTCDCRLKWLLEWDEQSNGVLKCKKDRSYENGQLCALCSSPKQLLNQDIQSLKDVSCSSPVIHSPHRVLDGDTEVDENDHQVTQLYKDHVGNIILNMTDEHGNKVNLDCEMKKSADFSKINWNQPHAEEIDINATLSLDFECPMNRENYEKLWKLIAYYSEVPVKLERELMFTDSPKVTYRYRQNPDQDSYYYTGVRSLISADPDWVIQPFVSIQLNRKMSTAKKVTLTFSTMFSQLIHTKEIQYPKNNWVMIDTNAKTKTSYVVVKGATCQLNCNVKSSESPSIQWSLPDGTILKAPYNKQDSRFSVSSGGHLVIKAADVMDSGMYQCIAQVKHETDLLTYRVVVQPPTSEVSERNTQVITKIIGEAIMLTCNAVASPDAEVNWILPGNNIIDFVANKTNTYLLSNGSLVIPQTKLTDSGPYVCIAVNQYGNDHYSVQLVINRKVSDQLPKIKIRPVINMPRKSNHDVIDDDGGSGEKVEQEESKKYYNVKVVSGKAKGSGVTDKVKKRKDRRKMNVWKNTSRVRESNIAEGRRKFESRRRINMGNKQIDPNQWANILAKVRNKNVQKTTEVPLLTTTEATTIPIITYGSTTPSAIARPPIISTVESITNEDEASADEEELLVITSPPQVTITQYNHDFTVKNGHRDSGVTVDEADDYSENTSAQDNQEIETIEPSPAWEMFITSTPVMSTLETIDINDLAYSTDEEEIRRSFIEWGDKVTDITDATQRVETMDVDHVEQHTSRNPQYGQNIEEHSNAINRQDLEKDLDETNLEEMDIAPGKGYNTPEEDNTHLFTTETSTSEPEEYVNQFPNERTQQPHIVNSDIKVDSETSWTEESYIPLTTTKRLLTTEGISDYDKILSKAMDGMVPKAITLPPSLMETKHNINGLIPKTTLSAVIKTDSIAEDLNEVKSSDDYTKQSENIYATASEEGFVPFRKENSNAEQERTVSIDATDEKLTPSPLTTKTPTVPIETQTQTTTASILTNGRLHYQRRRPNGRRRFGPNRFRHRQNQIIPVLPATTQVNTKTFIEKTSASPPEAKSTIKPQVLSTQTHYMSHYHTASSIQPKMTATTASTLTKPVVIQSPEMSSSKDMSPITSTPENIHPPERTGTKILELPIVEPVTTIETIYSTGEVGNIDEPSQLQPGVNPDATKLYQFHSSTHQSKTSTDFTNRLQNTDLLSTIDSNLNPPQPYTEYSTSTKEDDKNTVTESYSAPVTDEPQSVTETSIIEDTLRDVKYILPTEAMKTTSNSSPYDTTKAAINEETINIVNHTIRSDPAQSIPAFPLTKNIFLPTVYFHLKSTSKSHFFIPTVVPKMTKVYENTKQESITQGAKIVQAHIPSSRQNELDQFSSNQKKVFAQPKQEDLKDIYGARTNNSLLYTTKVRSQSQVIHNQHHAIPPVPYNPARPTMRAPYIGTYGPLRYFITNPPLHMTNKPEITAYTAQNIQDRKTYASLLSTTTPGATTTSTAISLFRPKPMTPSKFNPGQRISPNYKPFGNNGFIDNKGTIPRIPYNGHPYYWNQRFPHRFNRTRPFRITATSKPSVPTFVEPISTNKNNPIYYLPRTTTSSTMLRPTTSPITTTRQTTTSKKPYMYPIVTTAFFYIAQTHLLKPTSTIQSNWYNYNTNLRPPIGSSVEDSQLKHPNVVQPSVTIRSKGSKPRITTIGFKSISERFDMDAILPCDTVGEPKPSITWTKVSTGAMMTANTKIQRFDVLQNGTLHIQHLQLQDRGQYLCTAQNQYGSDRMIITLSIESKQPKMLSPRYKDVTVYLGDTVTLDCLSSGVPSPHISWIFPDRKIVRTLSTTESRVMFYENGTLSIKDTTFTDRGIFKCVASNVAGADSLTVRVHIAALPPIIQQGKLENISLPQGHSIYIHCSAKGAPLPSIRWVLLDGTQVRPSQLANGNVFVFPNGTLYIRNISQTDNGKYECIAANIVGAARRTVVLEVKKFALNAKITGSSPQKTDVTYGSTLRLHCSAAGDPWPRILWRLPSKRLVDSFFSFDSRIKTFANGTLIVYSVTDKDAGDYLCMARNKLGDDYVVLKVNVMMKPAKIEHKKDVDHKVIYGGDLKVDCVATGVPNPEISWSLPDGSMVNNVMQSDDSGSRTRRYGVFNNGTLYFNEVGMKDEGDYTCYAVNQIGQDEMRVSVKVVAERATIRNKTYTVVNVPYGDVVTASCEAKGEPLPKITWLTPANRLIPTLSDKYQIYRDGTLLLQKAQRSDSGNYTCLAHNSGGEDKKIVHIQVNVLPPKINGHANQVTTIKETAMKDSRILIDCNAEGIPTPRVMWAFPEGVILPAPYYGNRITVHRNGTLDIKVLRKSDSVQLTCIGRNEGGEAKLIIQLIVTEPAEKPKFISDNEHIIVAEGQTININCSATGAPEPERSWILPNGTVIHNGNHLHRLFHKRDGTLHIGSIAIADSGTYRCRAVNVAGHAEKLVKLQVGHRPHMNNHYNNLISIINGETLQLHCTTQGEPKPHITWTLPSGMVVDGPQNKDRISLLLNGTLIVRETSVYDRGSYVCKATTQYGSSTMSVPVIVIAYPPRITTSPAPVIYARPGSSVQLNCMSIGIPKAEITWDLPDKSRLTALAQSRLYGNKFLHPQGTLVIQHISKRDTGYYKCTAKNILGSDTKTTYIHIY
ncbi:matrix-remodeling-associated protein 5 [Pelodytes ibericus]